MAYTSQPVPMPMQGVRLFNGMLLVSGVAVHDAQWLAECFVPGHVLALDFETSGLGEIRNADYGASRWEPRALTLATHVTHQALGAVAVVLILDPRDDSHLDIAREIVDRASEILIHNAPFDMPLIAQLGIGTIDTVEKVFDTLTLARLALPGNDESRSLKDLCARFLGMTPDPSEGLEADASVADKTGEFFRATDIDSTSYAVAAASDTAVLAPLRKALYAECERFLTTSPLPQYFLLTPGHEGERSVGALVHRVMVAHRVMMRATTTGYILDEDFARSYTSRFLAENEELRVRMRDKKLGLKRRTTDRQLETRWLAGMEAWVAFNVAGYQAIAASHPQRPATDEVETLPTEQWSEKWVVTWMKDKDAAKAPVVEQPSPALIATAHRALADMPTCPVWARRDWLTGQVHPEMEAWMGDYTDPDGVPLMSLSHWLAVRGHLPADFPVGTDGRPTTNKKDLELLRREVEEVDMFMMYQERVKVMDDYLGKVSEMVSPYTGRLHPQVPVLGAASTGRMSASTPPIQQFPNDARKMIRADGEHGWTSIDWTSVEPMIAAYASEQFDVVHTVTSGHDLYVPIARKAGLIPDEVSDEDAKNHPGRKKAKTVLLGLLYGNGIASLAHSLHVDMDEAREIKESVLGAVPLITNWTDQLRETGTNVGLAVTAAGRVLKVGRDAKRGGFKGYQAQNYFHQGTGADMLMETLAEIHRRGFAHAVRLAMHDELVVLAEYAEEVAEIMRTANRSMEAMFRITDKSPEIREVSFPTDSNPLPTRWLSV